MSQILRRREVTQLLLDTLGTLGFPVGAALAPGVDDTDVDGRHAGWNGEPSAPGSVYVPYLVLTPATATVSSGPMTGPQDDIQLPYQLATFGLDLTQVEDLADRARTALTALRKTQISLNGANHKVQQVWWSALGGISPATSTDPPTLGEVDTCAVWLTKEPS